MCPQKSLVLCMVVGSIQLVYDYLRLMLRLCRSQVGCHSTHFKVITMQIVLIYLLI
jgi:hypothetical protein